MKNTKLFSASEFERMIPHEMRFKVSEVVNGNEIYWVTQEPFTREQLAEFQQAVKTYSKQFAKDRQFTKFYVTVRDLSGYDFEEDLERRIFVVVTPDEIRAEDFLCALLSDEDTKDFAELF